LKRIVNRNGTDTSDTLPEIATMLEVSSFRHKNITVHFYRLPDGNTLEYEVGGLNETPIREDGITYFFKIYTKMCEEDDADRKEGYVPSWEANFSVLYMDKDLLNEHLRRNYHPYVMQRLREYAAKLADKEVK